MNILFATDGSENSDGAAKFLTKFNFSGNDRISILHAINWAPVVSEWEVIYTDLREVRDEIVPRILESAENILKESGAAVDSSFAEGNPDNVIVEKAAESGADLVVIGASGVSGLVSQLIGSVARAVAIKSDNPVLVVKPPQWERSGKLKILYATDGSVYSESVARILTTIPFPDDTEVTILNTITPILSDIPERFALEINDRMKNLVAGERAKEFKESEEIIEKAGKQLSGKFSSVEKMTRMGNPSEEIIEVAKTVNADIIAIGSSGMRGIKGMLGSISRYVVNHCSCSVLIGKS